MLIFFGPQLKMSIYKCSFRIYIIFYHMRPFNKTTATLVRPHPFSTLCTTPLGKMTLCLWLSLVFYFFIIFKTIYVLISKIHFMHFPSKYWLTLSAWKLLSFMDWFQVFQKVFSPSKYWLTLCAWQLLIFLN